MLLLARRQPSVYSDFRIERALDRWSRRPGWCILLVALATFGIRAVLLPVHGVPVAAAHDEFSYLLGSDMFASGRLAGPAHPLAESFDSIHILVKPKYASKYQPGQALILALGQKAFGHPFWGVMISAALMNAAFCWMLFGWTSRRWALLVSVYLVLFFTANHYWMDSYWGGAVAAAGAALVLGGYPRLVRLATPGASALFALGLALLFLTRPYEGGVLAMVILLQLTWQARRRATRQSLFRWVVLLPALLILMTTLVFQATLNHAATGNAFTLPYALYLRTHESPPFLWPISAGQPQRLAATDPFRLQHDTEFIGYRRFPEHGLLWSLGFICSRLSKHIALLCYPALLIPFLLPALRKDQRLQMLMVVMLACSFSLLLEVWMFDHYAAPLLAAVLAFVGRGLWKTTRQVRPATRRALVAAATLLLIVLPLARQANFLHEDRIRVEDPFGFAPIRARMEQSLTLSRERCVVFVRYATTHSPFDEWIYNKADIDQAPVIWARDLGQAQNNRVMAYYGKSRHYWLLEADQPVRQLKDYDSSQPH
jgi:hypothetical protein